MTDEKLDYLESACRNHSGEDGTIELRAGDVLELVQEVRALRKRITARRVAVQARAAMHWLRVRADSRSYWERRSSGGSALGCRIPVQDPGR